MHGETLEFDQIHDYDTGRNCSTCGRDQMHRAVVAKSKGNILGRSICKLEDNIKVYLKEVAWKVDDCFLKNGSSSGLLRTRRQAVDLLGFFIGYWLLEKESNIQVVW